MDTKSIERIIRQLIAAVGEDPDREGLQKTPRRVARSLSHILCGYTMETDKIVNNAVFESHANNMIIIRNIEIYSMCEHHMLPFFGQCHIGYIAKEKVLGASKLARIVNAYSRRLQIQERLTAQVAGKIMQVVDAEGVGVVVECRHLCMMMRGVEKQNSVMTTSSVLGSFRAESATRMEFLNLISRK